LHHLAERNTLSSPRAPSKRENLSCTTRPPLQLDPALSVLYSANFGGSYPKFLHLFQLVPSYGYDRSHGGSFGEPASHPPPMAVDIVDPSRRSPLPRRRRRPPRKGSTSGRPDCLGASDSVDPILRARHPRLARVRVGGDGRLGRWGPPPAHNYLPAIEWD
jgi:hypothetical protein